MIASPAALALRRRWGRTCLARAALRIIVDAHPDTTRIVRAADQGQFHVTARLRGSGKSLLGAAGTLAAETGAGLADALRAGAAVGMLPNWSQSQRISPPLSVTPLMANESMPTTHTGSGFAVTCPRDLKNDSRTLLPLSLFPREPRHPHYLSLGGRVLPVGYG